MNLAHVGDRLGRRAHVRLGDNLEERRAGTIEIDPGHTLKLLVQGFTGVFFQMRPRHADGERPTVLRRDFQVSVVDDRPLELADLIALREVRIKVILAREYRSARNSRIDGEAEDDGHAYDFGVQHR